MDWERNDVVIKEWFLYYYLNYFNWSIAARNNKKIDGSIGSIT